MKINRDKIKQHLRLPLPILFNLVKKKLVSNFLDSNAKQKDFNADKRRNKVKAHLASYSNIFSIDISELDNATSSFLMNTYLNKEFCLLGSGLVKNTIEIEENKLSDFLLDTHVNKTKEIINEIRKINPKYEFINWQKDFKSNKSFSAKIWYKEQRNLINIPEIDIKVPWELSRMQHLPQLAIFALKYADKRDLLIAEFKCQVLDFIAFNPFNMGANWNCAMDVGIRIANLLLAFDWFKQLDDNNLIDTYFIELFTNYAYLHGKHIVENFEYKEGITSNHYLGNIAGLAFVGMYLEENKYANEWLLLSIQEHANEMLKQFMEDGTNFEGSTSYHRLSGEFFAVTTALFLKITDERRNDLIKIKKIKSVNGPKLNFANKKYNLSKQEIFDSSYYNILLKMKQFTDSYTKPNGKITQIGDNDSGRFIKLMPLGELTTKNKVAKKYKSIAEKYPKYIDDNSTFFDENNINHNSFLSYINGLFKNNNSKNNSMEFSFINNLSSKINFNNLELLNRGDNIENKDFNQNLSYSKTKEFEFKETDLLKNIKYSYFPNFGLLVFRSDSLYLAIRLVGENNYKRLDGHKHNDILSIELNVNKKDIILDPGTYLYTSNPFERNRFRSTKNHNTITIDGIEQRDFSFSKKSLFYLEGNIKSEIHSLNRDYLKISARYKNIVHLREIAVKTDKVIIKDYCNDEFKQHFNVNLFSNGYGKLLNNSYE